MTKLIIPERTQFGPKQGPEVPVSVEGVNSALAAANAGTKLGQAARELGERMKQSRDATVLYNRVLSAKQAFGSWYIERSERQDEFGTLENDVTEQLNAISEEALKGVEDTVLSSQISQKLGEYALSQVIQAKKDARSQEVGYHQANLESVTWQLRKEISLTTDENERAGLLEDGIDYIRKLTSAGMIEPKAAELRIQKLMSGVVEDEVRSQIYNNPDNALRILSDDAQTGGMDPDTRIKLTDAAQRRQDTLLRKSIADAEKAEREADRQLTENRKQNYAEAYKLIQAQEMDIDELDTWLAEGKIEGKDYDDLYEDIMSIKRAGGPGNPQVFNTKRMSIYLGRISSAAQLIHTPPGADPMNMDEIQDLQSAWENGSANTRSQAYRQAAKYLEEQLGLFDSGLVSKAIGSHMVVATAAQELYLKANENANLDPLEAVNEIVTHYLGRYSQAINQVPLRYESAEELQTALDSGQISFKEYKMNAGLLQMKKKIEKQPTTDYSENSQREDK